MPPPAPAEEAGLTRERVFDAVKAMAAISLALFSLYSAIFGVFQDMVQKGTHLALVLLIVFLVSGRRRDADSAVWRPIADLCLMAGAFAVVFYHVVFYEAVANRWGELAEWEYWLAIGCIAALLEATRRTIGWAIVILALVFLLYALLGPHLPGMLAHRGYSLERVLSQLYLGGGGIFGTPLGVSATFVILIIIYGAFLEHSGAGRVLMDVATGATGRSRGGPAKASVVGSSLMGMISGTAVALRRSSRLTPRRFVAALVSSVEAVIPVAVACATAGPGTPCSTASVRRSTPGRCVSTAKSASPASRSSLPVPPTEPAPPTEIEG